MGKRSRRRSVITQKRRPPRHGLQVWIGLTCIYPAKHASPRQPKTNSPDLTKGKVDDNH